MIKQVFIKDKTIKINKDIVIYDNYLNNKSIYNHDNTPTNNTACKHGDITEEVNKIYKYEKHIKTPNKLPPIPEYKTEKLPSIPKHIPVVNNKKYTNYIISGILFIFILYGIYIIN